LDLTGVDEAHVRHPDAGLPGHIYSVVAPADDQAGPLLPVDRDQDLGVLGRSRW